ncbi:MAG: hypothetical protein A3G32_03185 [Deltaproteobacteria bacterium RIFCSPLOWO2_12_FULL_40_28]|nr:MAG: hypothetical protein A3C45_01870 [Deltaproteobacteria bacterium RIFCSPHIGHO2_02_FULL_40_28]OGQ19484.1 MAG: hypothetical protein A3E27_01990 [Deltaproteobacteria bacterium RIFCSPHIGHO2_12_FULL_40_32]OGQ39958.1 MAG: hypothetical protein A3I69_07955 [Deltaproteobacteria bacterium RIFCSPLOWO2_02_FULL_40_36]OGQ54368.1 MAG: hypothetical protein A3G32_03185 [Deltaproteobacteria bacterium RIFCSPLOWO2_12_FULL_40_28]
MIEIISAKYLVSMAAPPLFDGAMVIENGEIIDTGPESQMLDRYPDALHEDYANQAILPGFINAHVHLDMGLHTNYPQDPVRSMVAQPHFVEWLLGCIEYKKNTSSERLREAVEQGIAACIESGITCVGDMGNYGGIVQSLEQVGLRGVVFPEVLSYDSSVARDLFETALAIVEKYLEYDSERISVGLGPYSPYTLSRNILRILSQYSRTSRIPLMMQVAESFSEMEFFYDSTGDIATLLFPNIGWGENLPPQFRKTPVQHLDEIGFLEASPILVGCVHVTPQDLDRIERSKSKIIWCPRSNSYLRQGVTPIKLIRQKGIPLALATDGLSSTNTLSLWDEMRFAHQQSKEHGFGLTAQDLLEMVTIRAAEILMLGNEIGSLVPGKKADYIVVDLVGHEKEVPLYDHLIQKTRGYHVRKVVVEGQSLKQVN